MGPGERQDQPKMAKLEPRWRQRGPKMLKMRQHGPTHAPILKTLRFPAVFFTILEAQREPKMAQERAKVGPRWPIWSQAGPRERQDRTKMAKLEPRWRQHGPKMAKDEPTWANIGTQHGLRLRITAPVQQIRPSTWGGSRFFLQTSSMGAGEGIY